MKYFMKDGIPTVTPEDVAVSTEAQLIDVRTPEEFTGELGHIHSAQLVTLGVDLDDFLKRHAQSTPRVLIFVCRSSARSGKATLAARALGITEAYNMDGGMLKWNALGLPTQV